ncbi:MAG: recombinase family protein, partial [Bradyrhizobium sp.]|nr:recombinase family protein [Bradyrhizobium sp.]
MRAWPALHCRRLARRAPPPDPARRDRSRAPGRDGAAGAAGVGPYLAAAGTPGSKRAGRLQCGARRCRPVPARSRLHPRAEHRVRGRGRRSRSGRSGSWPKAWPACCGACGRRRAVLSAPDGAPERVGAAHRAKLAYVYVRQSTAVQVRQHQESTELQYRLVDRAAALGWPRERIAVIDDDLGKSGASASERGGFQRLIAEIGLGKAGLVLSLDASRLARNNRDWHQLLELCSMFGVVIGDGERLYDPGAYHDRLLLGLSGIMSEAELHQIRMRLHQGERQKAARGELRLPLPAGLAEAPGGRAEPGRGGAGAAAVRVRQVPRAAERQGRHARVAPARPRPAGAPDPRAGPARAGLGAGRQQPGAEHPAQPGLRRRVRLWSAPPGPDAPPPRPGPGCDGQGRRRAVAGVPARRPPGLRRLGGVRGQPGPARRQRRPPRGGAARRAAQGRRAAAGHRRVRPMRAAHGRALLRPPRQLPRLPLRRRPDPHRRAALPGGAGAGRRCRVRARAAGRPRPRPDRAGGGGRGPAGGGSAGLGPPVEPQAGAGALRGRAGAAAVRCGRAGEPSGGAHPGAGLGGEAAPGRGRRAGLRGLARRAGRRAERGGVRRGPRPGPGLGVGLAGRHGRGAQAHAAPGRARGRPGPEARARPGLAADHLADRRRERAPGAAQRAGLRPVRGDGTAGAAHPRAERRRPDGSRGRGEAERRGPPDRPRHDVRRRERPPVPQALGHPDGQDQRRGGEPAPLAGRQLLGAGRGGGAGRDAPDRVQVAAAGAAHGAPARQGPTLADHAARRADRPVGSPSAT